MPENFGEARIEKRPLCFVVAPIGAGESEERKKSDQVLKHLIKKALEPEYTVVRADHIDRPGVITVQIVQAIFDASLVVADLTDRNPNVYYELAIRHAAQRPAIHIISRGQDIPFDVQDMRVVPYDLADPDSLEEGRTKLREYVKAIQKGEPVITPVQFAQILRSFEAGESRDAQLRALFESMNTGISNLQAGIAEIVQDVRFRNAPISPYLWTAPSLTSPFPPASGFNFPNRIPPRGEQAIPKGKAETIKKNEGPKENK